MTATSAPLPAERRARLLDELRANGSARVSDLSRTLGVTPVTVRRDLAQLAEEGVLQKVHGGARLAGSVANGGQGGAPGSGQGATSPDDAAARPGDRATERSLRTIGMVVPSLDYYWPEVIRGARTTAPGAGLRIILRGSSYEPGEVRRQVAALVGAGTAEGGPAVSGLLVAPPTGGEEGAELALWLSGLDVPVVLMERRATVGPYHEHLESVITDHALGAGLAVRHLAAAGHRRIGLVASLHSPHSPVVREGWLATVAELGLDTDVPDLVTVDHSEPGWAADVERALDACRGTGPGQGATALLVHSDPEAISLVQRAQERGLRVPGDLAVVAYDDEVAGLADPPITAIRPPKSTIGATAVELLARRIAEGPDRPVFRVLLSPRLIVRASSR
ncbi:substrate-binding domain-containing protein [Antribacter gilvus]|uniref:substrate-binding domain-containing protein n=1 Tax=Antribacter gilvus TaxID=2304675 RepID=UPI000F7708FD|nr:substrate-binding domain-containing protein [Antribacter gilvus]